MDLKLFRALAGVEWEAVQKSLPSQESSLDKLFQQSLSKYPLRDLGVGTESLFISEEDRESHIHILGSPGEGKSKFLELLLRQDIDRGYGACLLDPSDNGDTAYKVLKYAITKGYKKIVLIDTHDCSGYSVVPVINPIHYNAPSPAVTGNVMDSIRVLWGQSSFVDTPRIQKYLPAVIKALHASGMTMAECRYFMENSLLYKPRREKILKALNDYDIDRQHLEAAFTTKLQFESFQSTINRLQPFLDPTMEVMFGSKEGMDFKKLVAEGYLVLVNLDPEGVYGQEHQRLLGTIIINEITYAISRLRNSGWKGVYYLYIDEAGDYATSKLSYILDKKRKSGLRLTLSHQRFDQFGDKDVSSAVYGGTKIKVLFNTASRDDRDKMIRMMGYGGELSDRDVSYVLAQLKKQHAVVRVNKRPPVSVRLTDIPDVEMSAKELKAWKEQYYHSSPFHRPIKAVREEINKRFAVPFRKAGTPTTAVSNNQAPAKAQELPSGADNSRTPGDGSAEPSREETPVRIERSSIFDNLPDSGTVLRSQGRRTTRKRANRPSPSE